ncbi:MAG: DUF2384 domain-containing protein [Actinobacteria bacterium]|nr:DUF2384 domain-containing protein [Actinomycetota bacterium]
MTLAAVRYPVSRFEHSPWVDLQRPAERVRLSGAAVRSMGSLAQAWGLTIEQLCTLLGGVPPSTWHAWVKRPPRDLGVDRLTRVSYLLGIYSALHVLYPNSPLADQWVTRTNTNVLFGGQRPLDILLAGGITAMDHVRSLLDARRGGA